MATKIQIRRGTTTQRQAITLDSGELGFDQTQKQLYIGDGTTAGGIPVNAVSQGYIDGLKMIWVSTTAVSFSSGAAYVQGVGGVVNLASQFNLTGLSLTASTFYNAYLFLSAGVPTIELVTTAPATAFYGTARSKTGDTSRRYIGSILTDGSGLVLQFAHDQESGKISISGNPNGSIVASFTSTTWVSATTSAVAPTTATYITVRIATSATTGPALLAGWITNTNWCAAQTPGTAVIDFPNTGNLYFEWNSAPSGGNGSATGIGYIYAR
jgi:hypothetical protein